MADLEIAGEDWQLDLSRLLKFLAESSFFLDLLCVLYRNQFGTFTVSFTNIKGVKLSLVKSMVPTESVGVAVCGRHNSGIRFVLYSGPPRMVSYQIVGDPGSQLLLPCDPPPELIDLRPGAELVFDA